MNADRLLAHFNTLVDTPGAVPRLRRFILDLAVRGRLVPQDPTDEPASELLSRIAAEKSRLTASRTAKKQRAVKSTSGATDRTFVLPSGWSSTRLDAVTLCLDHMREPVNAAERTRRIAGKAQSELFPYFGATQQQGWIDDFLFDEELVLLGEDGVPFLDPLRPKAYVISGKSWVNNHAHVFRGIFVSNSYLTHWLNAFDYSGRIVGATRAKLNQSRALDIPIMLPPLAEQHRIVVKVDELMTLCDRLEEARQEREAARDRFAATNLARLSSPDPDLPTFHADAAFAIENFDRITARADQVAALRRTILDLAVRGRLVPQDPTDEPASELLRRTHGKNVKRIGSTREPSAKDIGCHPDLNGWAIAPLGALLVFHYGKGMSAKERLRKGPVPVFGSNGMVGFCENPLTEESAIIVGRKGSAGALNLCDGPSWTTDVAYYVEAPGYFDIRFLFIQLQALDLGSLGKGVKPGLSRNDAYQLSLEVPPLEEQRRIVARVDEMMALCDRLVDRLATTEDTCTSMLDVVLHEALESVHYGRVTGAVGAGQVTADG